MSMPRSAILTVGALGVAGLLLTSGCSTKTDAPASTSSGTSAAATPTSEQKHNQPDVVFAQQMIPHHQQAVEMSDAIVGKPDIDPRVIALAQRIKAAQDPEIQQMQGWLTQWGAATMAPGMDHGAMPGMDHGAMPGMTGMMTAQDMEALKNAQGPAASKLFLEQMIKHHEGAITMAQTEISTGQFPAAVTLATLIATSQKKEIDEMRSILGTI